tara:strand:- start:696 stop:995 length:300 start_codon:yes stop_codon:yes gene_type:complete
MKYKSIEFLKKYFITIVDDECDSIIDKIYNDYKIDKDKEIYKGFIHKKNDIKMNELINGEMRCLGLIKSGDQCARSRSNGRCYCKIHQKTLKFGKKIIN